MNRFRTLYQTRSQATRPLILAHRGDSFHAPENTMEAARLGLEAGADGWELDVRLTLDGQAVVVHDESLLRTTDVARTFAGDPREIAGFLVSQFSFDEVQSLDAGSWFVAHSSEPRSAQGFGTLGAIPAVDLAHFGSGSVRIPSLLEALQWTVDVAWLVNVEIKPTTIDADPLVAAVLDAIERTGAWEVVTVSSFDHRVVESVRRLEPRVATGALISGPLDEAAEARFEAWGVDAIHGPAWSSTSGTSLPVLVYTVNDAEPDGLAQRLSNSGVAGLFTDDPRKMTKFFDLNRS